MRNAINFLLALRRLNNLIGQKDEGEELKKKAIVWREKMDADHKAGLAS